MKLTIFALLSAVTLALTTTTNQSNPVHTDKLHIPDGYPQTFYELGKLVDEFYAISDKAYVDGIDVDLWFLAMKKLQTLQHATEYIRPKLDEDEQWYIGNTITQINDFLVKRRNAQAVRACNNGNRSNRCNYFLHLDENMRLAEA